MRAAMLLVILGLAMRPGPVQAGHVLLGMPGAGTAEASRYVVLAGSRAFVVAPLSGHIESSLDFTPGMYQYLAAILPDRKGARTPGLVALGQNEAGHKRIVVRDIADRAVLARQPLPRTRSYQKLETIDDYDGGGSSLLVAWTMRDDGSVRALLRSIDGATVREIAVPPGYRFVDAATLQRGPGSRLVMLGIDPIADRPAVISCGLDGSPCAMHALPRHVMPVRVLATASNPTEPITTVAVLARLRTADVSRVFVQDLGTGKTVRTLRLRRRGIPRDFAIIAEDGTRHVAVLSQSADQAGIEVLNFDTEERVFGQPLEPTLGWRSLAMLPYPSGFAIAVLGTNASDGSATIVSVSSSGAAFGPEVAIGPAGDLPRMSTVVLEAVADTTLYESSTGNIANGAGEYLFVGVAGASTLRRTLLRFAPAEAIPLGAKLVDGTLTLHLSRTRSDGIEIAVHRVTTAWSEGTSNGSGEEGGGTVATVGDATWIHTSYPDSKWKSPGGDASAVPVAQFATTAAGLQSVPLSAGMVDDVHWWITNPQSAYGWMLRGDESGTETAVRFDSRTHPSASLRPRLRLRYWLP